MTLRQLLSFAAMAALLSSCAKVQGDSTAVPELPVRYQVVSLTKAASAYPTDREFVSWAWYLPDGGSWAQNSPEAQLYIPGETVSYNPTAEAWTTAVQYYWPKSGSLTFMSLSPAGIGGVSCSPTDGITVTDYDISGNHDLMVADIAEDRTANSAPGADGNQTEYTGVPTVFRHKLAKVVSFSLKTDRDYGDKASVGGKQFILKKISFSGIYGKGTYVSGNSTLSGTPESWGGWSEPYEAVYYDSGNADGGEITLSGLSVLPDGGSMFVLPQVFAPDARLTVEYVIRTCIAADEYHEETVSESVALSGLHASWEMNRQISYGITIGLDAMEWSVSAEDWEDRTGGDITV